MQRLNVVGTWKALTEFGLSHLDLTEFRGRTNAAQQKSPLLNDVRWRSATFRHTVIQTLCMLHTHRYCGILKNHIIRKINTGIGMNRYTAQHQGM